MLLIDVALCRKLFLGIFRSLEEMLQDIIAR